MKEHFFSFLTFFLIAHTHMVHIVLLPTLLTIAADKAGKQQEDSSKYEYCTPTNAGWEEPYGGGGRGGSVGGGGIRRACS